MPVAASAIYFLSLRGDVLINRLYRDDVGIRKFPGQTEPTMSAEVELISTMGEKKSWTRPPIQMEFQVPMFTVSGLRVRFLKVWEKTGYNTVEWVRYITKAGSYEIRC